MTERIAAVPGTGITTGTARIDRVEQLDPIASASGLSWPAILAGAAVAGALWFSLTTLGAGLGLSAISAWPTAGASARGVGTGAIVWLMLVQALSCALGGYLAGRLRARWATVHGHEVHFRDTAHGFLVWAVGLVFSVLFLSSMGATLAREASAAATQGADDYYVDTLFRGENPSVANDTQTVRKEAAAILANALARPDIAPQDRGYLTDLVTARTGLDRARAEARVNDTVAAARQAAETARKALAHSMYWLFASLLLGAFCGSLAATVGGRQRDNVVIVGYQPAGGV
jgi:hypothetical protein